MFYCTVVRVVNFEDVLNDCVSHNHKLLIMECIQMLKMNTKNSIIVLL